LCNVAVGGAGDDHHGMGVHSLLNCGVDGQGSGYQPFSRCWGKDELVHIYGNGILIKINPMTKSVMIMKIEDPDRFCLLGIEQGISDTRSKTHSCIRGI